MERLEDSLLEVHQRLRGGMMRRWDRCLPFDEELFDRWEKAKFLGFGKGTSVYQQSCIFGDVKVGKNTWIGPYTILDGTGRLAIGDNCSISAGVQIYTHDSAKWAVTAGKAAYEYAPVKIGKNCFIGPNTLVLKGVKIGASSIVGGGSVVTSDIKGGSIAFGSPARVAGKVIVKGKNVRFDYFDE